MHWLTGSGKDQPLYKEWCNLGALADDVSVYNRDPFYTYNYNGQNVCIYRDVNSSKSISFQYPLRLILNASRKEVTQNEAGKIVRN